MNRRVFQNRPLTDAEIAQYAPSAFAVEPWQGMSSRYAFVPTSKVIAGMRNAGFLPFNVMQSRTRILGKENFTKHLLRFRAADQQLNHVGDTAVEAILANSHDGASCYEISLGAFRLTCENGAMVSEGLAEIYRVRHTGNIITDVVDATRRILGFAPKVVEAIKNWKGIQLNVSEQKLLAEAAYTLRFDEPIPGVTAENLLASRRYADNGTDLWTVYNRIQENVIKGGIVPRSDNGSRVRVVNEQTGQSRKAARTRGVVGIAENTKLNRALWTLAEEFAKLKGQA